VWSGSHWRATSPPSQKGQVFEPGANSRGVLSSHDSGYLSQVTQVVCNPGGQELPKSDGTQLGVPAPSLEIRRRESKRLQPRNVGPPQLGKGVQQFGEGFAPRIPELGKPVEGRERLGLALGQDQFEARNPVGTLSMDEVTHNVVRTPGLRSFIRAGPKLRQLREPRVEHLRAGAENWKRIIKGECPIHTGSQIIVRRRSVSVLAPHTSTGPLILIVGIALLGCGHAARQPEPGAVVFQDRLVIEETDDKSPLRVPPAQLPQPGECRLWKPQKPLGEQARPGPCAQIEPTAPPESWILYRPSQDPRLVHVRVVDPDWAGRVVQVRVYDAARGTYLGSQQRRPVTP
jgi:hypothetical protein